MNKIESRFLDAGKTLTEGVRGASMCLMNVRTLSLEELPSDQFGITVGYFTRPTELRSKPTAKVLRTVTDARLDLSFAVSMEYYEADILGEQNYRILATLAQHEDTLLAQSYVLELVDIDPYMSQVFAIKSGGRDCLSGIMSSGAGLPIDLSTLEQTPITELDEYREVARRMEEKGAKRINEWRSKQLD